MRKRVKQATGRSAEPVFSSFSEELMQDPPLCADDLPPNKVLNNIGPKTNIKIDKIREDDFK